LIIHATADRKRSLVGECENSFDAVATDANTARKHKKDEEKV